MDESKNNQETLINPFIYDAAPNLSSYTIQKLYIEHHIDSRFIPTNRNVFLLGERGSGKSMMLLYNSFKIKRETSKKVLDDSYYDFIGIYIPCKTPLFQKTDYELLEDNWKESVISEHYLVLGILSEIAKTLKFCPEIFDNFNISDLFDDFEYLFNEKLLRTKNFSEALGLFAQKRVNEIETMIGNDQDPFIDHTFFTFPSLIIPILDLLKQLPKLNRSHFLLMFDDAHALNIYQKKKLNSWVAYRDHSLFSLKIATADIYNHLFHTESGGEILEGHDFLTIHLEMNFQNSDSPFYKLAKEIIERRLALLDINSPAEEFFPTNKELLGELEECKASVQKEFIKNNPGAEKKKIRDYVYKYYRVEYFRRRAFKANLPAYSGFDILAHISTGVIRNLLIPCYKMYDKLLSQADFGGEKNKAIDFIPPKIQSEILKSESDNLWEKLRRNLSLEISNCTEEEGRKLRRIFEALGDLFFKRLKTHRSEPRILAFIISGSEEDKATVLSLLSIARRALYLYERSGPGKGPSRRETFYVPNRLLWIARGLDPVGQHGRVSLKAADILKAGEGTPFPNLDDTDDRQTEIKLDEQK